MWKLLTPFTLVLLLICTTAVIIANLIGIGMPSQEIVFLAPNSFSSWLHLVDVDHGLTYRIANAPVLNGRFALSSDGARLAFISDVIVSTEIFVAGVEGHSLRQVTVDVPQENYPTWSPDGRYIAFSRPEVYESTFPDIYVINVEDRTERALTHDSATESNLAWSPDGTQIAYVSTESASNQIKIIDAQTGELRLEVNELSGNFDDLAWSPDSTRLIFTASRNFPIIYVVEIATNRIFDLTSADQNNYLPTWSPDNQSVAFVSGRDFNNEIYVMDADGSNERRLTFNRASDMYPAWSPDGSRIAFSSTDNADSNIFLINADGSNLQRVMTGTDLSEWLPRWRP
jgi:Tol biopolymer transport system component